MMVSKSKAIFFGCFLTILISNYAQADFADICGVSLPVEQLQEVDDKNQKLVIAGEAHIIARSNVPEAVLAHYSRSTTAASSVGFDKWKAIFEACLKQGKPKLASQSFILFLGGLDKAGLNADFLESVFLGDESGANLAKEVAANQSFAGLPSAVKNVVFLSLGISDIHWLRANLLGKTFYISEEFKNYSEARLTETLKIKNVKLAKKIATMLETLYLANAEKYKKYNLACSLIEDLLSNEQEPTSAQLLTLVSIRNTDTTLRPVLDPFLIEGFHSLAAASIQKGKYEDALGQISSINSDQATPTTYEVLRKIVEHIDPASKIVHNETVNNLLVSAAKSHQDIARELEDFYYRRALALLAKFDFNDAAKTQEYLSSISDDKSLINKLKVETALKQLQSGQGEAAKESLKGVPLSLGSRISLFIDGYYGMPLFYILIILIPLLLKIIYEFFTKAKVPAMPREENEYHYEGIRDAESAPSDVDVSQFVSNNRMGKQKNALLDEYKDCLSIFGLERGVDLKTIKTAYRNAVRKIHPDLNSDNQSPDDASRFVELTKTYDRLREIHRLLGLDSK